ncbi:WD40/YVTN/BNR-like repeat-containing protein [Massilia sp. CT11-137]|uniref:WD40/YVTN/BNR-like repeat-containing protein n=1 Tax=Massilia sp. CT11-137 TaxID=3393901 RepID=UPI0039AF34B9
MKRALLTGSAVLGFAAVLAAAAAPSASPVPAVLRNGALGSNKATTAAALAVARAGQRMVVGGERGIVLLSDDAGASWHQAKVPVQTSLTAIRFVDARTGWAVGHLGTILTTGDGGLTWTLQLDGVRAAALQAASLRAEGNDRAERIASQLVAEGPDKPFFDIDFADSQHGFAVGAYNLAFMTSDGGRTWTPLSARLPNPKGLHLTAVRVAGKDVYIAGEQGLLMHSSDGGATFEALPSPYKGTFFGLLLTRSGTLLAYGLRGNVFRTPDRGAHWVKIDSGVSASVSAGIERDDGSLVLLAQTGDVLVSRDGGASFQKRPTREQAPAAGLAAAPDGGLIVATLRGVRRQPKL